MNAPAPIERPRITTREKIDELARELAIRRNVYGQRVARGKMSIDAMNRHMLILQTILDDYKTGQPVVVATFRKIAEAIKIRDDDVAVGKRDHNYANALLLDTIRELLDPKRLAP